MNSAILTFNQAGGGSCLYTELIDLHTLGALEISRASNIEFNNETQMWEVKDLKGAVQFSSKLRALCLKWEYLIYG